MKLSVITSLSTTPCSGLDLDDSQSEAGLLGEPAHRPRVLLSRPWGPGLACRPTVLQTVSGRRWGPTWGGGRGGSDVRKSDQGPGAQGLTCRDPRPRVRPALGSVEPCAVAVFGRKLREEHGGPHGPFELILPQRDCPPSGRPRRCAH